MLVYTVNQQADLAYYESYYDSTLTHIQEQGYYRKIYVDKEWGYSWIRDLVWDCYNPNGDLVYKVFYNRGKIEESPAMPQPDSTGR